MSTCRLARPVTTDHAQVRMGTKPGLRRRTAPILEQIHHLVGLQIDDHRSIGRAFAKGKIIPPNLGRFGKSWGPLPAQLPTRRRDRRGQMKKARQPLGRFMSARRTQGQQRLAKPLGHPRSRQQEEGESFGKNATSTVLLATEESSGPKLDTKGIATTGNVTKRPLITAVLSH